MEPRTAITFTNKDGLRLFGVLHMPRVPSTTLALILLSPGVKMRVGPQRLYLRLTQLVVSLGIPVLRFDFYGLGDSEGTLEEDLLKDVYNHIEVGRFLDDTFAAMDWMEQRTGARRFILSGLCGGAITGLLAGAKDPRVAGLLALGITPLLASTAADPSRYMTSGQLEQVGRTYLTKLLHPQSWRRLITLQSDYGLLWRSVSRKFPGRRASPDDVRTEPPENDNASPLFPPAFFSMLASKRPMLLVFGGSDRLHWEFDEKFVARHRERLSTLPALYDVHTIEQANHVLSFNEWQQEMLDVSTSWLRKHFSADVKSDSIAAVEGGCAAEDRGVSVGLQ